MAILFTTNPGRDGCDHFAVATAALGTPIQSKSTGRNAPANHRIRRQSRREHGKLRISHSTWFLTFKRASTKRKAKAFEMKTAELSRHATMRFDTGESTVNAQIFAPTLTLQDECIHHDEHPFLFLNMAKQSIPDSKRHRIEPPRNLVNLEIQSRMFLIGSHDAPLCHDLVPMLHIKQLQPGGIMNTDLIPPKTRD